nr:ABC transporter permease [Corynebacterium lactis]
MDFANSSEQTRFPVGTFTPAPQRAETHKLVLSQAKLETTLFWRHGEQMLLTIIIPLAMLIGFTVIPLLPDPNPLDRVFPMVLAISVMSAGFTGQAIAVGFDRRYGALKRIGASAVPPWGIIAGKIVAVCTTVTLQYLLFSAVAVALGASLSFGGWMLAYVGMLLGTFVFTSLGLLMGGTLGAEMILGLANLIWFIFVAATTYAGVGPEAKGIVAVVLGLMPSVALADVVSSALQASVAWSAVAVLLAWGIVGAVLATRWFQFDMKRD